MFYGNGAHMNGWGYGLMSIGMVLFWGLVILAVVALVRYVSRTGTQVSDRPSIHASAQQVLAERFARGEIDEREYQERLNILRGGDPAAAP